MYERPSKAFMAEQPKSAGSLVIPILIGASWLAIAIASVVQLDDMGRTLSEARDSRDRGRDAGLPVTASSVDVTRDPSRGVLLRHVMPEADRPALCRGPNPPNEC